MTMVLRRRIPEFLSPADEQAYRDHGRVDTVRSGYRVLIAGTVIDLMLIANDFLLVKTTGLLIFCVVLRLSILTLTLCLWPGFRHTPSNRWIDAAMFWWISLTLFTMVAVAATRPAVFLLHVLVNQAHLFAVYLVVPLRYRHRLICGIGSAIAYLAVLTMNHTVAEMTPFVVAMVMVNVVGSLAVFHLERSRRLEYAHLIEARTANAQLSMEIAERQRLYAQVAESEQYLARLFEVTPIPLALSTVDDGRFLRVNQAFLNLFRLSIAQLEEARASDFYENRPDRSDIIGKVQLTGGVDNIEIRARTFDGAVLWLAVSLRVLEHQGRRCLIMCSHDVSIRHAEEDALRAAKQLAEEASLAKSHFLAAASHDLRQPMHALGMFVGALQERAMDEEARKMIGHMDDSIAAMNALFSALLDVSRLDAGIVEAHPAPIRLQAILERIQREFAEEALSKGVRLIVRPCSHYVHSDPLLLGRILGNLVSNAVRYTDHGKIVIGCRSRGAQVSIQVWDSGRGVAPEHHGRIFQEFYQVANAGHDRTQGMGLGLPIVKRLTELLGHTMQFRSRLGQGSMFAVDVLRVAAEAEPAMPSEDRLAVHLQGLVLVIDDENSIQNAMFSLLHGWGLEVVTAGSGQDMLTRLSSLSRAPDLIVCDYRLQGDENGIDVIHHLQQHYHRNIPGVLITGDTATDRLREAQASGFVLLHKPVPNARLRATVGALLRQHGSTKKM
ncbi:hybrid sensor histidine kinase/response regulator [Undibacterium sp. Ji50W]|uniref:ATP-binding response regulator n=1 Tax=Undibacterium sp. Ji50W TaxID=3413041 RepID=UPI003BF01C47